MTDGSVISVAAGTRLTIAAYGAMPPGSARRRGCRWRKGCCGRGRAGRAPASFEVNTAVGAAAVRSTDWFIEFFPTRCRSAC